METTTVLLCVWAACVSCVAGYLIWDWESFVAESVGAAKLDPGNTIEGRTLVAPEFIAAVARGVVMVLMLAAAPLVVAYWLQAFARSAAARWVEDKLPCRHRVGRRCRRCGKTRYRVDASSGVVHDPQYPDRD